MNNPAMKLVVVGASGKMGQALIRVISETDGAILHAAIDRPENPAIGTDAGELTGVGSLGVAITTDPLKAFVDADGVLDFTVPKASVEYAGLAAQARIVHVIGTTGFTEDEEGPIEAASRHARIIKSGNMSLGVNLLGVLIEQAATALAAKGWDIEVLEMHHRHKVDAPSGTALLLGEAAARGRDIDLKSTSVRTRDGYTGTREEGTIGFATLRGGSVVGEHSVYFAGEGEVITLSHKATDRNIFARGAVQAALWGKDQKPGQYSMLDVLGLSKP